MPHMEPGFLTDCALSVPIEPKHRLDDTAAAEPPLEPPAMRFQSHGLMVVPPSAHSCRLVFPRITAPASLSFVTTVASKSGIQLSKIFEPAVVLTPLVAMLSLIEKGMPCSGPR